MKSEATHETAKPSIHSGLIIGLLTILLSFLILEGVVRWVFNSPYQWDRRLMFFSEGHNFRNAKWGGVAYQPHRLIHAQTYYITNVDPPELRAEYDYRYTTNANGLVQLNEFTDSKPAIVFLGDSFAEGQGARPWFYGLERDWPQSAPYQVVNGGILGTGVEAWGRLYRELSTELNIEKAVILYISDDWTRPVWQFPQQTLDCLKAAAQCQGSEDFYGLPEDPIEAQAQITRIAQYRIDYLSRLRTSTNVIQRSSVYQKVVLPAFHRLYGFLQTGSFRSGADKQFEISKGVATNIVAELGRDNVLFMYLPEKSELDAGPKWYGRKANDFIAQSGFAFVDGHAKCGLSIQDYYERDGHPNASGYAKIGACVKSAIEGAFPRLQVNP
jgi:hypothetical protein